MVVGRKERSGERGEREEEGIYLGDCAKMCNRQAHMIVRAELVPIGMALRITRSCARTGESNCCCSTSRAKSQKKRKKGKGKGSEGQKRGERR
jgi:hypothetical protein